MVPPVEEWQITFTTLLDEHLPNLTGCDLFKDDITHFQPTHQVIFNVKQWDSTPRLLGIARGCSRLLGVVVIVSSNATPSKPQAWVGWCLLGVYSGFTWGSTPSNPRGLISPQITGCTPLNDDASFVFSPQLAFVPASRVWVWRDLPSRPNSKSVLFSWRRRNFQKACNRKGKPFSNWSCLLRP